MQLGMIGPGRMRANLARRLMRDGHEVAVFDVNAGSLRQLGSEGAVGARSLEGFVASLDAPKTLATGGVYLGGGIPPKILPKLREGGFLQAPAAKGRFAPLLERMPVRVVLNDRTALIGAALAAAC